MKVGKWSTTPGNNNATPPDGWPEGQAPSTVNDCAREMMASIKTMVNDLEYIDYDNTPSYLSATTFSLGTADATRWEVGRRVKLYDAATLYGTITSVSGTFVQVRLDSGALTSSLSSAALAVIKNTNNSLPDSAFRNTNLIINGDFNVWQRSASFGGVTNLQYTADRFRVEVGNSASVNVYRQERSASATFVPTLAEAGRLINNSLAVAVSAADATVAAGDFLALSYIVEGYDFRAVAGKKMHLSFWVNTNKTGTYAVSLRNDGVSASYVQNFTVSAASTWTRFFMPLPEAPLSPYTWNYSSGSGLVIDWALQAGSTFQATAGEWTAMNAIATSSQVNFCASAGNTFAITGIEFGEGWADVPKVQRPAVVEFEACRRYYWKGLPCQSLNGNAYTANAVMSWPVAFPIAMRITPSTGSVLSNATWTALESATYTFAVPTPFGARFLAFSTQQNGNCNVAFGSGDYFTAEAEL